jgi:hypothetical protein
MQNESGPLASSSSVALTPNVDNHDEGHADDLEAAVPESVVEEKRYTRSVTSMRTSITSSHTAKPQTSHSRATKSAPTAIKQVGQKPKQQPATATNVGSDAPQTSEQPVREAAKAVKTLLHRIALSHISEQSDDDIEEDPAEEPDDYEGQDNSKAPDRKAIVVADDDAGGGPATDDEGPAPEIHEAIGPLVKEIQKQAASRAKAKQAKKENLEKAAKVPRASDSDSESDIDGERCCDLL